MICNMRPRFLIPVLATALLIGSSLSTANAQHPVLVSNEEFRPTLVTAIDSVYNFQFRGSKKVLRSWQEKYPDHPLWTFWDGFILWWKMLPDLYSREFDEQFFNTMKHASYQASQLLKKNPDHLDGILIQAASLGYMSRMHANRRQWVDAMQIGRNALNAFERVKKIDPDMSDIPFGDGLYSYYMAYIPETYPVVKSISWMLEDGDKEQGIEDLKKASEIGLLTEGEAYYFLANIYLNYEDKPDLAIDYLKKLINRYPRNNYYARALIRAYIEAGRKLEAKSLVDRWRKEWHYRKGPVGNVMKEELHARTVEMNSPNGNMQQALASANVVDSLSDELYGGYDRPNQHRAHYFLGMMHYEQENYRKAQKSLQKVADSDNKTSYRNGAENLIKKIKKR